MTDAYNLLSDEVKRFIKDKKWESFRPIQSAAITKITSTKDNYILVSRTASGKTEAAFLPIISQIKSHEKGVQVLYISPLIALINDQFIRVQELCKYLDIKITKWHGDASRSEKEKLLKNPSGILLITPESLEAMFVNKPYNITSLFSNLEFVVVDEIHSFLGTERGIQLKSLISRIKSLINKDVRFVGLSATLGDFEEAKNFFGSYNTTHILRDKAQKELDINLFFFKKDTDDLPKELIEHLYNETKNLKSLIFPNSRGLVEEISVKLKKLSSIEDNHNNYFSHHSSINKELREYIEDFAKNTIRQNFSIVCTSTLELGIDIGSVDLVTQINSTFSVSSLSQRAGRSGRRENKKSNLILYSTDKWSLLQSIACVELLKEGFIESIESLSYPIDILFHQILSILKQKSGIELNKLIKELKENSAFTNIEIKDILSLLKFMVKEEYVEDLKKELILGIKSDYIVNNKNFYSVFKTDKELKVIFNNTEIAHIPLSHQIVKDQNIFLAAHIWKIKEIDFDKNRIYVEVANDGKKPKFFGSQISIHKKVRDKMLEILMVKELYKYCDESCFPELNTLRKIFERFNIYSFEYERPVIKSFNQIYFFSFTSTKINKTLEFIIDDILQIESFEYIEKASIFIFELSFKDFDKLINDLKLSIDNFETLLDKVMQNKTKNFNYSKWGSFLDDKFKKKLLLNSYFDILKTKEYLNNIKIVKDIIEDEKIFNFESI